MTEFSDEFELVFNRFTTAARDSVKLKIHMFFDMF